MARRIKIFTVEYRTESGYYFYQDVEANNASEARRKVSDSLYNNETITSARCTGERRVYLGA